MPLFSLLLNFVQYVCSHKIRIKKDNNWGEGGLTYVIVYVYNLVIFINKLVKSFGMYLARLLDSKLTCKLNFISICLKHELKNDTKYHL